ncbi:MAG: hypothetical protein ACRDVM_00285 [Acidimicrobiia bacterium]
MHKVRRASMTVMVAAILVGLVAPGATALLPPPGGGGGGSTTTTTTDPDPDRDGLTNEQESDYGTSPTDWDAWVGAPGWCTAIYSGYPGTETQTLTVVAPGSVSTHDLTGGNHGTVVSAAAEAADLCGGAFVSLVAETGWGKPASPGALRRAQ